MARKIVWTKRANQKLTLVATYLSKEWGNAVATHFLAKTFDLVDLLGEYPFIGSIEVREKKIRGLLITPHNRLFYRVTPQKVIVLNIFDTRMNSKQKKN